MKRPPNIPEDKANHYIYTQLAAFAAYLVLMSQNYAEAVPVAFGVGVFIAVAWEVMQKVTKSGEPSVKDALWGIAGSAAILAPLYLITH